MLNKFNQEQIRSKEKIDNYTGDKTYVNNNLST